MARTTSPPRARTQIVLAGEHDISTGAELAATLARAIATDDEADLVVDLAGVSFMDASTLTVLLRARIYLRDRRRRLHVQNPSRPCRRVLDLCQLHGLVLSGPVTQRPLSRPGPATAVPRARRSVPVTSKAS